MASTSQHGAIDLTMSYSLQDAIDHMGFGWFQYKTALLSGLCQMCEGAVLMIMSMVGPILRCKYQLSSFQLAALPATSMLGSCLANPLWGMMSDRYGRKPVLLFSVVFICLYTVLVGCSPNIEWLFLTIFLSGFSLAGSYQSVTLCSEFVPTNCRLKALMIFETLYASSMIVVTLIAKLIVPTYGFWTFILATRFPDILFVCLFYFLPESVRFLMVSGRYQAAQDLLIRAAKTNGRELPKGRLSEVKDSSQNLGQLRDLFSPQLLSTTLPLMTAWFCLGIIYLGVILIGPVILVAADGCHALDVVVSDSADTCWASCRSLTGSDYTSLLLSSLGEIVAIPCGFIIMTLFSRRRCLMLLLSLEAVCLFVSIACMPRMAVNVLLFVMRTCGSSVYMIMMILHVEVFPTTCRSVGVGVNFAVYKLGSFLTPLIAQILTSYGIIYGFVVYGLLCTASVIAIFLLPVETKHKQLTDTL